MSNDPKFKKNFKEFSFDVVIPSHLILNENVCTGAKLFYGLVRNLTRVEGYCYATNSYLSDLMGVCEKSIKTWLSELESEGYIERELEKEGIQTSRKIFISHEFQKSFTSGRKLPPGGQNSTPGGVKNYPHKEDNLKEDNLKEECSVSEPPAGPQGAKSRPLSSEEEIREVEIMNIRGEARKISKQELISQSVREKKDWSLPEIEESWKILCIQKVINDPFHFLEGTIKNLRSKKKVKTFRDKTEPKGKECQQQETYQTTATKEQIEETRLRLGTDLWGQLLRGHN